ncbi:MAG TPA: SDR family oxidoreductase, partial [Terriglobia bacterium]|nr:SDR family oxidoreductase [Terriglobia bacterium]
TELRRKDWQEVIDTNLTAPFLLSRECLRHMTRRREGCIINISSTAAHWAYPLRVGYSASKAGLLNLTITLAQEAGKFGIRVNAICPGPTSGKALSRMLANRAQALGISVEEMRSGFMRPSALGRMVEPDDIGHAVVFLASEAAQNITGQIIDVSAGYGLYPAV